MLGGRLGGLLELGASRFVERLSRIGQGVGVGLLPELTDLQRLRVGVLLERLGRLQEVPGLAEHAAGIGVFLALFEELPRLVERSRLLGVLGRFFEEAQAVSEDLQILAHPIRLQILDLLAHNEGMVCVCDLEAALPVKQPTISHHLKLLADAGLIVSERFGLWAYYIVQHEALAELRTRIARRLKALG